MILCVAPNPAVDKTLEVAGLQVGQIHRPQRVLALPGGKGINLARAVQTLGGKPFVTGWVGGFNGAFVEAGLRSEGIEATFIHTDIKTRTCLSILDTRNGILTEFYEAGDALPASGLDAFMSWYEAHIGEFQAVTLSGSLPPGVPPQFYSRLSLLAQGKAVPVFLDAAGEALRLGLESHPTLIKPNQAEFCELVGRQMQNVSDLAGAGAVLARTEQMMVLLSLGERGALAVSADEAWLATPPIVDARSAVGSGDALLAGTALALLDGLRFEEAVRRGVAAGTANALTIGAGRFSREDYRCILSQVKLEKI